MDFNRRQFLYKNGSGHAFTLCHDTAFTSALAVPRP